jgi:hypothetical protein
LISPSGFQNCQAYNKLATTTATIANAAAASEINAMTHGFKLLLLPLGPQEPQHVRSAKLLEKSVLLQIAEGPGVAESGQKVLLAVAFCAQTQTLPWRNLN